MKRCASTSPSGRADPKDRRALGSNASFLDAPAAADEAYNPQPGKLIPETGPIPTVNVIQPGTESPQPDLLASNGDLGKLYQALTPNHSSAHLTTSSACSKATADVQILCADLERNGSHEIELKADDNTTFCKLKSYANDLAHSICPASSRPEFESGICLIGYRNKSDFQEKRFDGPNSWNEMVMSVLNQQEESEISSLKLSLQYITYPNDPEDDRHARSLYKKAESMSRANRTPLSKIYLSARDVDQLSSKDDIEKVIETDHQAKQLNAKDRQSFGRDTFNNGRRLFVVFILAQQPILCLKKLLAYGKTDNNVFPIDPDDIPVDLHGMADFHQLSTYQWQVHVPSFTRRRQHQDFRSDEIMPILTSAECGRGAHSRVFNVKFHPAQQTLDRDNPNFALKVLYYRPKISAKRFQEEKSMLEELYKLQNPHIIELLCTWTQKVSMGIDEHCLLFPLADCTLKELVSQPPDSLNAHFVHWFFEQLLGLAVAVAKIHSFEHKENLIDDREANLTGYHHDLKLENILVFRSGRTSGSGRLVITDFGLGKFHTPESGSGTKAGKGTPEYAAPESDEGRTSRPYDMWSLGCIFMDLMIWVFYGPAARNRFAHDRFGTASTYEKNDAFYVNFDGKPRLRDAVEDWLRILESHQACQGAFAQLHTIIRGTPEICGLFEIQPDKRMKSGELVQHLGLRDGCFGKVEKDLKNENFFLNLQGRSDSRRQSIVLRSRTNSLSNESMAQNSPQSGEKPLLAQLEIPVSISGQAYLELSPASITPTQSTASGKFQSSVKLSPRPGSRDSISSNSKSKISHSRIPSISSIIGEPGGITSPGDNDELL